MATRNTYLGYVQSGTCRDDRAPKRDQDGNKIKQPKMLKQLWVERELESMGIEVWVGRRIKFVRRGNNSYWDTVEEPLYPNYIFLTVDEYEFFDAISVEHLAPTLIMLTRADMRHAEGGSGPKGVVTLPEAKRAAEEAYIAAKKVDANNRASVVGYKRGQELKVLSEIFDYMTFNFEALVRRPGDNWPMVEAKGEMMGQEVRMRFNPTDVRAAE